MVARAQEIMGKKYMIPEGVYMYTYMMLMNTESEGWIHASITR